MQKSFLKSKSDSKSSGSVVQRGATVDSIEETSSEKKSMENFVPTVAEYTTKDGLNMKCVSLASHEMAPKLRGSFPFRTDIFQKFDLN